MTFAPQPIQFFSEEDGGVGEEGEGGFESFFQGFSSYFCGGDSGKQGLQSTRKVIPPPIDSTVPGKETEKYGTTDKNQETTNKDELQPLKPFYYVLPPTSLMPQGAYYLPPLQFIDRRFRKNNVNLNGIRSANYIQNKK